MEEIAGPSQRSANPGMTEIRELLTSMMERLDTIPDARDNPMTIFRLPYHEIKKELCEPKVVSIGPYHRGNPNYRTMENYKWRTLLTFISRNTDVGLEYYLEIMKAMEALARRYYSEPVELNSDEFVMMLVLDGCFILEWIYHRQEHILFSHGWNQVEIFYDLLLMENQLPFFILHDLSAIQVCGKYRWLLQCKDELVRDQEHCPIIEAINQGCQMSNDIRSIKFNPVQVRASECFLIVHLLALFYSGATSDFEPQPPQIKSHFWRSGCFPCSKLFPQSSNAAVDSTQQTQNEQGSPHNLCRPDYNCFPCFKLFSKSSGQYVVNIFDAKDMHIMCVSELSDAGVKFKRKESASHMLDISFANGTIAIPFLKIDYHFVRLLWNLVAYEQILFSPLRCHLSSFLALMDSLIDTSMDIDLLERAGIIDNYFSNAEEASVFFNQFGKIFTLRYDDHYFRSLFRNVKRYSESTWPSYRARFIRDYFSNPWTIISVGAAIALFALTILQTYYSAKSV